MTVLVMKFLLYYLISIDLKSSLQIRKLKLQCKDQCLARDTNKVVFESMYAATAEIVAKFTFNLIEEFFYSNFKQSPPLTLPLFWSNVMLLSFGIGLFKKEALPLFFSGLYLLMNGGYKTAYSLETPEKINSRKKTQIKGSSAAPRPGPFPTPKD